MTYPPASEQLFSAIDATWPAARMISHGDWVLREGCGGGKRVSAATALNRGSCDSITQAENGMRALGQTPLFMIRDGNNALDDALAARGYDLVDPVCVLSIPVDALTNIPIPRLTTFTIWEPLAIMRDIWASGGIGPERIEVMERARTKTSVLARWNQKAAGVGFVAVHKSIAMVHAVEVLAAHRRQGVAQWIMRQAAFWAQDEGADTLAVLCTKANKPALSLYSGLGFSPVGQYHYRMFASSKEL